MPSSMEVKYLWRRNPRHGPNINITTQLNFLWCAHQMVLFLLFHLFVGHEFREGKIFFFQIPYGQLLVSRYKLMF